MKTKSHLIILLVVAAAILYLAPPASAGGHHSGIKLAFFPPPPPLPPFFVPNVVIQPERRHGPPPPRYRQGHWEWRKVWVPGKSKRVWRRGHHGPRGRWTPSSWIFCCALWSKPERLLLKKKAVATMSGIYSTRSRTSAKIDTVVKNNTLTLWKHFVSHFTKCFFMRSVYKINRLSEHFVKNEGGLRFLARTLWTLCNTL